MSHGRRRPRPGRAASRQGEGREGQSGGSQSLVHAHETTWVPVRLHRDRKFPAASGAIIGGMPERTMTWAEVAGRLSPARTYWLGTTTPSGAPHAAPVWGVVTGDTLYLYSERSTVKARNLAIDPRVVIHLESGEDVLIVRGVAEDLGPPAEVPSVVAALAAKYARPEDRQYLPDADPAFDVVYALRPRSAMAWRLDDYAASQRRWSF